MSELADHDLVDFLSQTVEYGGSDLHITVGSPPLARIHGELRSLHEDSVDPALSKELIFAVLKETQRAKLEENWELDFALEVANLGRFRANVHYVNGNVEGAFRYIAQEIPTLDQLGHEEIVSNLSDAAQGLLLVTGITGSGKSTTLAAIAQRILNKRSAVIVTIEDPIEFVFTNGLGIAKQREVGTDSHSFPNALRAAMRQDPDIIIVSELRDLATIQTAITAAETGHLVISTLHTMDAPNSVDRLVDVFPPEQQQQIASQLAGCLVGVVSQRLLKTADGEGRCMATEIMVANSGIRTCIREHKLEQLVGLIEIGAESGMQTMDKSLAALAASELIPLAEALVYARDKDYVAVEYKSAAMNKKKRSFWKKGE